MKLKIFSIICALFILLMFNSCGNKLIEIGQTNADQAQTTVIMPQVSDNKSFGPYLAGRVAHLRKDFDNASDYYIKALENDPKNADLVGRIYVILASKGKIAEAAKYAEIASSDKDANSFTHIIIATDKIKQKHYREAVAVLSELDGKIYEQFIVPLLSSWAYVGLNEPDNALKSLKALSKDKTLRALYNFHAGMINDYFGLNDAAQKHYEVIVNEESLEMSFRALQIISNFYLRTNQKDKAVALVGKYSDDKNFVDMLHRLNVYTQNAQPGNVKPIVTSAELGLAEALFNIAATLRQGNAGIDLAHVFVSLSIYSNPQYDLAKLLLADILENRGMYKEANAVYEQIDADSMAYNTAQIKMAGNFVALEDYQAAEIILKTIIFDNPDNQQLFLDLGDVLRLRGKPKEAVKYYQTGIAKLPKIESQHWILFYALGVAYESNDNWDKAEEALKKALKLSSDHYLVLNYLGYSWLRDNKNIEEAFAMIVDAYNQMPSDPNINDSLGWALYKLGYYNDAVSYLEQASENYPSNAVITDHLGDAYWAAGRRNEAIFQWEHALKMNDSNPEFDKKKIKSKIDDGLPELKIPEYDADIITAKIAQIKR